MCKKKSRYFQIIFLLAAGMKKIEQGIVKKKKNYMQNDRK